MANALLFAYLEDEGLVVFLKHCFAQSPWTSVNPRAPTNGTLGPDCHWMYPAVSDLALLVLASH